jgi:hypothetical protein
VTTVRIFFLCWLTRLLFISIFLLSPSPQILRRCRCRCRSRRNRLEDDHDADVDAEFVLDETALRHILSVNLNLPGMEMIAPSEDDRREYIANMLVRKVSGLKLKFYTVGEASPRQP